MTVLLDARHPLMIDTMQQDDDEPQKLRAVGPAHDGDRVSSPPTDGPLDAYRRTGARARFSPPQTRP
jgi:hypothetical protein